jgi:quercetin dioxygenase-like cupin family protein
VQIVPLDPSLAHPIGPRLFEVRLASAVELAAGTGEAHAYLLSFEPGGAIGPHAAEFGQLFLAVSGDGWVSGRDGVRTALREGDAAFFERGEIHAKGSETGLTALMIQVRDLGVAAVLGRGD